MRQLAQGDDDRLHQLQLCRADMYALPLTSKPPTHREVTLAGTTATVLPPTAARLSLARASPTAGSAASIAPRSLASSTPRALPPTAPSLVRPSTHPHCYSPPRPGDADRADCDGTPFTGCEINLRIDNQNCGQCGRVCHSSCSNSSCLTNCTSVQEAPVWVGCGWVRQSSFAQASRATVTATAQTPTAARRTSSGTSDIAETAR